MSSLVIDCGTCVRQDTEQCTDCMVTFLAEREPGDAVVIDAVEFAALKRMHAAGLVPALRHESVAEPGGSGRLSG